MTKEAGSGSGTLWRCTSCGESFCSTYAPIKCPYADCNGMEFQDKGVCPVL